MSPSLPRRASRRPVALLGAALATILASAPGLASAQETKPVTIRFNHVLGPKEAFHQGFRDWAKRVEERTQGGVRIEIFHSAQLGIEEDVIEQIRQGAALAQNTDAARLGTYVPGLAVMNGPYFVESIDEVMALRKSPSVQAWRQELADRHGLQIICHSWVQGARHFFTNKPVRTPDDLQGQRIRTPPAPIWQESVRALGASPLAMAFGDMYPALQQRAIDGVELVYGNIPAGRFYEVLKYANETRHILLINFEVMSSKVFKSLPAAHQAALTEECDRAGEATSRGIAKDELEIRDKLKKRGTVVVDDVDLAAFRKAGEQAYQRLNLTEARDRVHREIGKTP